MGFFSRLFGGGSEAAPSASVEHKGVTITPTPIAEGGQFRLSAALTKTIGDEEKTHRLIRADVLQSKEQAEEFAIRKAKQVIDEQGDSLFH